jgi:hypothetical protein
VGAFGWTVVGSVAGIVGATAAVVFGVLPFLRVHREAPRPEPDITRDSAKAVDAGRDLVVVGDIPQEPLGYQPRADLLAAMDWSAGRSRVMVAHAVTGMRGWGRHIWRRRMRGRGWRSGGGW